MQRSWVLSKGSATGLQELVAVGVDAVTSSVVEASSLIEAGRVKSRAVMGGAIADVATLKEATGSDWSRAAWPGVAGPKAMPDEATAKPSAALENVLKSDAFQEFMSGRGFGLVRKPGAESTT